VNPVEKDSPPAPVRRPFEFTGRVRSFGYAIRGLVRMMQCQHNAWIHAMATAAVVGAGFLFDLSANEWCWIVLAIAGVWTAEALNTAFEFLADAASPEYHPLVRDAKDVAAGAVLVTAVAAALVGGIIFWPHVMGMF
jgi:diacylglycerol kinase (ATP)